MRFIRMALRRALGFWLVFLAMSSGALAKALPEPETCFSNLIDPGRERLMWSRYERCFSVNDPRSCWMAKAYLDGRPGLFPSDHGKGCQYVWALQGVESESIRGVFLRKKQAKAHIDAAIQNRSDLPGGYYYLAKLLFAEYRLDDAMAAAEMALKRDFRIDASVSEAKVLALQAHIQESMDLEKFEKDLRRSRNRDYFQNIGHRE